MTAPQTNPNAPNEDPKKPFERPEEVPERPNESPSPPIPREVPEIREPGEGDREYDDKVRGDSSLRFAAYLSEDAEGFIAEAEQFDLAGRGPTRESAVKALREALEEKFATIEAVAPPSRPPQVPNIEVVVVGSSMSL